MNTPTSLHSPALAADASRNRVLRNTYWLLAFSLLPTLAGAWLGVSFNFSLMAGSPFISFVLFLAIAFGFFWGIE
ncbi:MAG: BAX inhibitor (BI)-1/YccA family protein, partial [Burkholderiaceae bacterium]